MTAFATLQFRQQGGGALTVPVETLVIAGWTGRDAAAVEAHIIELAAIGVPRPSSVPVFYRVGASLLTTAEEVEALGDSSSGEVEFVLFGTPEGMLIATGSDHTDRKVESYSISVSKHMCPKPVSPEVWRFDEVADHFDQLVLRSWAVDGGRKRLYQEGTAVAIRPPLELVGKYTGGEKTLPPGTAMFCGTFAVHGEVKAAERFEFELEDPVRKRKLTHGYTVRSVPIVT
jgi:hypothetical protein